MPNLCLIYAESMPNLCLIYAESMSNKQGREGCRVRVFVKQKERIKSKKRVWWCVLLTPLSLHDPTN